MAAVDASGVDEGVSLTGDPNTSRSLIPAPGPSRKIRRLDTMTFFAILLLAATAQASVPPECGDWPQKPAWEWTDEERLDRRSDERCTAARRALAAQTTRADGWTRTSGNITDFVYGTDTPELFLPWELLDSLLFRAFVANPKFIAVQRPIFEDRMRAHQLALPQNFWERVETAGAGYRLLLREQRAMASKLDGASPGERRKLLAEIETSQRANCAARHRALTELRAEFGAQNFDRFLYLVVAHGLSSSGDFNRRNSEWISRGCSGR